MKEELRILKIKNNAETFTKEIVGKLFFRLKVLEYSHYDKRHYFICECQCENKSIKVIAMQDLKSGNTKSCGCWNKETRDIRATKHNLRYTRFYTILNGIIQRCTNSNNRFYHRYGGRGINVCKEWLYENEGLKNFYNWSMLNGYEEHLSIDRINNDGDYEPSNCRWVTMKEQGNNKSNNIKITFKNKTQNLKEWERELNIDRHILLYRFKNNLMEIFDLPTSKIDNYNRKIISIPTNQLFKNKSECSKFFNVSIPTIKKYIDNRKEIQGVMLKYL